jgi:hypothetical protein
VSRAITTQTRRELRRIIGPEMAEIVGQHNIAILAMSSVLNRGFWGRLRWLLFGR